MLMEIISCRFSKSTVCCSTTKNISFAYMFQLHVIYITRTQNSQRAVSKHPTRGKYKPRKCYCLACRMSVRLEYAPTFWSFVLLKETTRNEHVEAGQQKVSDSNMKRFKMPLISWVKRYLIWGIHGPYGATAAAACCWHNKSPAWTANDGHSISLDSLRSKPQEQTFIFASFFFLLTGAERV